MKKILYTAMLAITIASCTSYEATPEHYTFLGASIGMPKQQALDSLLSHVVEYPDTISTDWIYGLEDKCSYYYADCMMLDDWGSQARFIFENDTLRSVLFFASAPDDLGWWMSYIADSTEMFGKYNMQKQPTGEYTSKILYNGQPLVKIDTICRIDEFIEDTTIYIAASIGGDVTGFVPIVEPTKEQLTVGHGGNIILGGDEYEMKKELYKRHGMSLFGDGFIMTYPDVFVENMQWKFASYMFRADKLWLVSLDSKEMSRSEAESLLNYIVTSSRFHKRYNFVKVGDEYHSSVKYFHHGYNDWSSDTELAGGKYMPLITAKIVENKRKYKVEIDYQYN